MGSWNDVALGASETYFWPNLLTLEFALPIVGNNTYQPMMGMYGSIANQQIVIVSNRQIACVPLWMCFGRNSSG